ncbi:MAG: class I SAM-dependent methyltransferase [bacterium]|nr:class I SAM-dependent methyltransferase [bacterium]
MSETQSLSEQRSNFVIPPGIYHALYRASEFIGGETWGDNVGAYTEIVKSIPEDARKRGVLRMLLLGSATSTSIEDALATLDDWKSQGIISDGKLTVIDISTKGLDRNLKDRVDFVQADIRNLPLKEGQFNFVTSDYILNFVPLEQIQKTLQGLSMLLAKDGILAMSIDTKKRNWISRITGKLFVPHGLTRDGLDNLIPEGNVPIKTFAAISKGAAKINNLASDRIVWGFQRQLAKAA